MYSKSIIEAAIDLHNTPGRKKWRYLPMTEKQKKYLKSEIPADMIDRVDRGAAQQLLNNYFQKSKL